MKDISFTEFEEKFDSFFEQVADKNEQLRVSLDDGRKAVIVSKSDWDQTQEKIQSKTMSND